MMLRELLRKTTVAQESRLGDYKQSIFRYLCSGSFDVHKVREADVRISRKIQDVDAVP